MSFTRTGRVSRGFIHVHFAKNVCFFYSVFIEPIIIILFNSLPGGCVVFFRNMYAMIASKVICSKQSNKSFLRDHEVTLMEHLIHFVGYACGTKLLSWNNLYIEKVCGS